jgi:hypothetical protein
MMAVGSPIPVPHIAPGQPGFNEAVDAAHEQLVNALVELYYKYRVSTVCSWVCVGGGRASILSTNTITGSSECAAGTWVSGGGGRGANGKRFVTLGDLYHKYRVAQCAAAT